MDNSKCHKCEKEFVESDNVVYCPTCEAYHHLECWEGAGGCSNPECNDYVHKPTYSWQQNTSQNQENNLQPKKKKVTFLKVTLILFLSSIALLLTGVALAVLYTHVLNKGGILPFILAGLGITIFMVSIHMLFVIAIITIIKKSVIRKRKHRQLKAEKRQNATHPVKNIDNTHRLLKEKKKKAKKKIITASIFAFIGVVILIVALNHHTVDHFADNLGNSFNENHISTSQMYNYGLNPSKHGIKDCISADRKSNHETVIIIECRSILKAKKAEKECYKIVDIIEDSSGRSATVVRKGNCILVGHTSAVNDALK